MRTATSSSSSTARATRPPACRSAPRATNLKAAVAGETHEYTDMYPGMAKTARDEGFDEIADWFETLAKAERSHANRYQKALDAAGRLTASLVVDESKEQGAREAPCSVDAPPRVRMSTREGNLEAPTRHPIDWKSPTIYDEAACFKEMERVFDICHGCRRCVSLCQSFPDAVRPGRRDRRRRGARRREEGLLEGRRPVLPVRPVLHDQVPVRAAAPVEPGLPAPDAARQGDQVQQGRGRRARSSSPRPTCTASSPAFRSSCRWSMR